MDFHAVADIFPLMETCEFEALCEDIRKNGLLEDITTADGKIVDGRNRYNACLKVGITPRFSEWNGKGSLIDFVVSKNLRRRQLNESQRALVASKLANLGNGQRAGSIELGVSHSIAADMLNVSTSSVKRASFVRKNGVTDLEEKIEAGEMTVAAAAAIAKHPKGKQKRLIQKGRETTRKLLIEKKTQAHKNTLPADSLFLACLQRKLSRDEFLSLMDIIAEKQSDWRRYIEAVVEEITGEDLSEETRDAYDRILDAVDRGFQTFAQIQTRTGYAKAFLTHTLSQMLDYDMLETAKQGGKTETARGATNTLYRRKEVTEYFRENPLQTEVDVMAFR